MLLPILKVVTFVATELNLYWLPFVTFHDFPNTLPELVVKSVALLLKTRSVKEPGFVLVVGVLPRLQLVDVFKLGLLPVKMLTGGLTVSESRKLDPVPTELEAVKVTVVGPTNSLGVPLICPLVLFNVSPLGRSPEVTVKDVAPGGSVMIW